MKIIAQLCTQATDASLNVSLSSESCTESPRLKLEKKKDTGSFLSSWATLY